MADSLGSITFTIPYTSSEITQTYLNDYEYTNTGFTNGYPNSGFTATSTGYTFIAIGTSRLSELKKYGSGGYTQSITTGITSDGITWKGYTIDTLNFQDFSDGTTQITGTTPNFRHTTTGFTMTNGTDSTSKRFGYTSGNTTNFATEYVINNMLTRNEHFLGFVEQPTVYSDVFVERGKQGVMENNLRLGEIDNMGELSVYGNKFFTIKKQ
jgi:hypothetical protein